MKVKNKLLDLDIEITVSVNCIIDIEKIISS